MCFIICVSHFCYGRMSSAQAERPQKRLGCEKSYDPHSSRVKRIVGLPRVSGIRSDSSTY